MAGFFADVWGTTKTYFRIGTGIRLKDAGGVLTVRDATDANDADVAMAKATCNSTSGNALTVTVSSSASVMLGVAYVSSATIGANITLRHARGTQASPTQVLTGDVIGGFFWGGYGATQFAANSAAFRAEAAEDFTDSAAGCDIVFYTAPVGSTTRVEVSRMGASGYLTVGTGRSPVMTAGTSVALTSYTPFV